MHRLYMALIYPVVVAACLLAIVWLPIAICFKSQRTMKIMVAADRMANATFGGSDKETISSRAYRESLKGERGWCLLCKLLHLIEKDHCKLSEGV